MEPADPTRHVVLLGDSIFDNGPYVASELDTTSSHLRAVLPKGWQVSLLAVDGHITRDVARQLTGLPNTASHLVVSVGGNDALQVAARWPMLAAQPFGRVALQMAGFQRQFRQEYRAMLQAVLKPGLPTTVCTIYTAVPGLPEEQVAALSYFNDVIVEEAARARVVVVDLRQICESPDDYSGYSPIEPSGQGGRKIARVLGGLLACWSKKECPTTWVVGHSF